MPQAAITAKIVTTVTANPAEIADGDVEEVAVTIPGVALGDFIVASKETDDDVYIIAAFPTAANTAKLVFFNPSGSPVNCAAQTINIIVF